MPFQQGGAIVFRAGRVSLFLINGVQNNGSLLKNTGVERI